MKYLVYIGSVYQHKNSLQKAVKERISELDRMVFDESEIEAFKIRLTNLVNEHNSWYPKCTPLQLAWHSGFMSERPDWHTSFGGELSLIALHLYSFEYPDNILQL